MSVFVPARGEEIHDDWNRFVMFSEAEHVYLLQAYKKSGFSPDISAVILLLASTTVNVS